MSTPIDVKRKASFEPGSAPPKKMALLASSHPDPSTPDGATDPKKAAPSAHSSMNATVLQRQNLNLQTSLDQKRRDLEELQQKLERTEKRLLTQENAISVLDRHWEQTEQQATALLARVQDDEVAAADGAPGGLLGQLSAPKPLTPGELDGMLARRAERFQRVVGRASEAVQATREELRALGLAVSQAASSDGAASALQAATRAQELTQAEASRDAALATKLQAELTELAAAARLSRDQLAQSELDKRELREGLELAKDEAAKSTKDLHKLKQKVAAGGGGSGGGAAGAPNGGAAEGGGSAAALPPPPAAAVAEASAATAAKVAELREDLREAQQLAETRRGEAERWQREAEQMRSRAHERSAQPAEEQLRGHVEQLRRTQAQLEQQAQQASLEMQRLRGEVSEVHRARHAELARLEGLRQQQHGEAAQEAERAARQSAQFRAERDALALQLAQKALGQQARERKVKELDAMATLCRGEHERCKGEVQRLRAQLAERDKERDAALADKESLREQAHAKELLLEQAQARAAGSAPAEPELHEAEKRCQEALVRLGSAEQRALQAQQGLSSVKGECAALQAEVGAISEAFEEVQNQNVRLLEDVQQKDEAATKLMTERLRSDHEAGLLKAERKLLEEKASVAEKLRTSLDELQKSLDEQSKLARDALGKKDEEGRHLQAMVDKHKKDASTAYREAQAAAEQLKTQQKTAQAAADRQSKQVSKSSDESMQVKRLQQEKDVLQRKVTRLTASAAAGGGGGASSGADEQVDYYRRLVKCTLCQENEKNAIISKCGHTFCRDCIDERLANRNRKCPACSQQFDYQGVKELFLTN